MVKRAVTLLLLGAAAASAAGVSGVTSSASDLCAGLVSLLPAAAMLMVALSGVIYAAGQLMGAETRARASTWATACLAGAIMAVLIAAIGPSVVGAIYPGVGCEAQPFIVYTQQCAVPQGCICRGSGCVDNVCANGKMCAPCSAPAGPTRCV